MQRPQSIPGKNFSYLLFYIQLYKIDFLGCPPGLEYLTQIDNLQVEQLVSLIEAFTGWDTNNKYVIKNNAGAQVYYAFEETDTCMRICCAARRAFTMHIVDNFNNVIKF